MSMVVGDKVSWEDIEALYTTLNAVRADVGYAEVTPQDQTNQIVKASEISLLNTFIQDLANHTGLKEYIERETLDSPVMGDLITPLDRTRFLLENVPDIGNSEFQCSFQSCFTCGSFSSCGNFGNSGFGFGDTSFNWSCPFSDGGSNAAFSFGFSSWTFSGDKYFEGMTMFSWTFGFTSFTFSNTGFTFSNTGFGNSSFGNSSFSNSGFTFSYTGFTFSNSGFTFSNTGFSFGNSSFGNSGFTFSNTGFSFGNSGFSNTGFSFSNSSFSNSSFGFSSWSFGHSFFSFEYSFFSF